MIDQEALHPMVQALLGFQLEERTQRLFQALNERTRYISVVLEDIFHSHNANAVVRSCECYGIQDLYVIENKYRFAISRSVNRGSVKWVDLHRFDQKDQENTMACMDHLRKKGYLIAAATPHTSNTDLYSIPLDWPIALMFGREKEGLSKTALREADVHLRIPMYGFTESLNISVAAAIAVQHLTYRLRASEGIHWRLTEAEQEQLLYRWLKSDYKGFDLLQQKLIDSGIPLFPESESQIIGDHT